MGSLRWFGVTIGGAKSKKSGARQTHRELLFAADRHNNNIIAALYSLGCVSPIFAKIAQKVKRAAAHSFVSRLCSFICYLGWMDVKSTIRD